MKRTGFALALLLAAVGILSGLACSKGPALEAPAPAPQVRQTVYGAIEGVDDRTVSGTCFWKGVPFAKPPVGGLRWRAPEEPEAWTGTRAARTFAQPSAQAGRIYGPGLNNTYDATIAATLNQALGSEDSLYLNIWRPATAQGGLPVVFFIHGGSNLSGYTADPLYDGAALARSANAVVVTANYRLGLLGWLDLPQLKSAADPLGQSGNFGTLDQIQALKFVHRNIAQFGGDPGNVTVMGESAGAVNVWALITSPLLVGAKPALIHRAVMLSGGLALPSELPPGSIALLRPLSYARTQGEKLLHGLLIADGKATDDASAAAFAAAQTAAQIAEYLRAQPPSAIFKQALTTLAQAGVSYNSHIPDGAVVARSAVAALRAGQFLDVPMIIGNTREETKLFSSYLALSPALGGKPGLLVDDATRFRMMMDFKAGAMPSLTERELINPAYWPATEPATGYNARLAKLNDLFFVANAEAMLQALPSRAAKVWRYSFDWAQEPAPWNTVYGASHLFDLPFMFGNFGPSVFANAINSTANQGGRLALSRAMMAALGAFAWRGDPNHAELGVAWPVYPKFLTLDATLNDKKIAAH